MSLTESRLTRTSQSFGATGRTHQTIAGSATATSVAPRRGRAFVRAAMWAAGAWRAAGSGVSAAADWASGTIRPAGHLNS